MGNKWDSESEEDSSDLLDKDDDLMETDESFDEDDDTLGEMPGLIEKDEY